MKKGCVIIIYNKKITESITFNSIKNSDLNILLIDNSTDNKIQDYNLKYAKENNLNYLSKNKNIGLSKAYNIAIDYFKDKNISHLILFDDDTKVSNEYLELLNNFSYVEKACYAPLIYNGDKIVNPTYHDDNYLIEYIKTKNYNTIDDIKPLIKSNKLFAINSGLIIPYKVFDEFRYDEKIFLDCVDHYFCREIYKLGYYIDIFPAQLEQTYNVCNLEKNTKKANDFRLDIRLKDIKNYDRKNYFINKLVVLGVYFKNTKDMYYLKKIFKKY